MRNKIKYLLTIAVFWVGTPIWARTTEPAPGASILDWAYDNIIIIFTIFIVAGAGALLWNILNDMMRYQSGELLKAQGITPKVVKSDKVSILKRMYDKAWSLVPIERESDIDLGHNYDGIRELDNKLPPWWLYTFYVTIVISFGYMYVYHFSDIGLSQQEEYALEMKIAEEQSRQRLASQANTVDEENIVALTEVSDLDVGKSVYIASCSPCHGVEGQGGIGPNLTDPYWIHGGGIKNIFKVIKYGVPEKGMIPWEAQMQPAMMQKLASYILTMEGTNPPNPKEAQGEIYTEELSDLSN